MIKRHTRPNPPKNIAGGISEREASIHISNVMLVDPDRNVRTRIGRRRDADGKPGARRQEERRGRSRKTADSLGTKTTMAARLKEQVREGSRPGAAKEFGIDNVMAVPRLEKIVLNMGLGEAVANPKMLDGAVEELSAIAGPARRS